jgi:hypothetical protein
MSRNFFETEIRFRMVRCAFSRGFRIWSWILFSTSFWWRKLSKTIGQNFEKTRFWHFSDKSILGLSPWKQKLFKKTFLSKCLELKALQTLKISSKSEITFVQCGWDSVELPYSLVESLISLMKSKEIFLFSTVKDDVNKKRKIIDCLMIME